MLIPPPSRSLRIFPDIFAISSRHETRFSWPETKFTSRATAYAPCLVPTSRDVWGELSRPRLGVQRVGPVSQGARPVYLARHGVCLLSRTHEQGCVRWMEPSASRPATHQPYHPTGSVPSTLRTVAYASCLVPTSRDA
jgi:hypothetical protein